MKDDKVTKMPPEVGRLLKEARKSMGWNQLELCRRAGLSQNHISRIEGGQTKNPGMATMAAINAVFEQEATKFYLDMVDKFLATEIAHDMGITAAEADRIRSRPWFAAGETPTISAWVDFVRALRGLQYDNQKIPDTHPGTEGSSKK